MNGKNTKLTTAMASVIDTKDYPQKEEISGNEGSGNAVSREERLMQLRENHKRIVQRFAERQKREDEKRIERGNAATMDLSVKKEISDANTGTRISASDVLTKPAQESEGEELREEEDAA